MKFLDLFRKTLKEERSIPEGKRHLLLIDIDDNILKAAPNMKIYRKLPTDKTEVALTPEEYAKEEKFPGSKKYYDYRDFRDPKKVYESIVKGMPYINNLKVIDDFYNAGADLGVLTARGCEDVVYKAVKAFLKVKTPDGKLVRPELPRERVHAVNDDDKHYPGDTDADKKKNVIKSYAKIYDYVTLQDDDKANRDLAINIKKTNPEFKKTIRTIDSTKNRASRDFDCEKNINEEALIEMALKDVTPQIIDAIKSEDYDTALRLYFDVVKNQPSYQGKADAKSALKHLLTFGIARTFAALEKKGDIPEGSAQALKRYGIENADKIAQKLDYIGNPDYKKPERAKPNYERKVLKAKDGDELVEKISAYTKEGWTCKVANARKVTDKKDGSTHIELIITRPKAVTEEVLSEMAVKDVSQDIIKDINDGDYVSALRKYFEKIKDTATYAAKPTLDSAYSHMLSYGISRTFNALEKKGTVPSGTSAKLKEVGGKNKQEVLAGLQDTRTEAPKEEKKTTNKEPVAYEKNESGALKKIADRVAIYSKMRESIEDYMHSSNSIKAFVYDEDRNGKDGIDSSIAKPKLTASKANFRDYMKTKSERYLEPMFQFRAKFIPKFLMDKFDAEMPPKIKDYLEKAERLGQEYYEATKNSYYAGKMAAFLNNIVEGLREFNIEHKGESLSDAEALKVLKEDGTFPYSDFVKYEKWMKERDMKKDKMAVMNARKSDTTSASIPTEIFRVRDEYVNFVNALEKAQIDDTIADFVTNKDNYKIIRAILETPSNAAQGLKDFNKENKPTGNGLAPRLKVQYDRRLDLKPEADPAPYYSRLDSDLNKLVDERAELVEKGEDTDSVDIKIAKLAEKVSDVLLDRIAALDILFKSSQVDGGVLKGYSEQAKRYHAIKLALSKVAPKSKRAQKIFDKDDPKYDKYYSETK